MGACDALTPRTVIRVDRTRATQRVFRAVAGNVHVRTEESPAGLAFAGWFEDSGACARSPDIFPPLAASEGDREVVSVAGKPRLRPVARERLHVTPPPERRPPGFGAGSAARNVASVLTK